MKNENRNTNTAPYLEPYLVDEPLGAQKAKRLNPPFNIHVHVVRKRLGDVDGISAKAAIDGLVKAGIFQDDSPEWVKQISFTQEKGAEEKTIITILEAE